MRRRGVLATGLFWHLRSYFRRPSFSCAGAVVGHERPICQLLWLPGSFFGSPAGLFGTFWGLLELPGASCGASWVLLAWGLLGPPGALGLPWGLLLLHLVPPLAPLGTSWELLGPPLRLPTESLSLPPVFVDSRGGLAHSDLSVVLPIVFFMRRRGVLATG